MCLSGWMQMFAGIAFLLGIGVVVWLLTLGLQQVFHSGDGQGNGGAPQSGEHTCRGFLTRSR